MNQRLGPRGQCRRTRATLLFPTYMGKVRNALDHVQGEGVERLRPVEDHCAHRAARRRQHLEGESERRGRTRRKGGVTEMQFCCQQSDAKAAISDKAEDRTQWAEAGTA